MLKALAFKQLKVHPFQSSGFRCQPAPIHRGFLSPAERDHIIAAATPELEESRTVADASGPGAAVGRGGFYTIGFYMYTVT